MSAGADVSGRELVSFDPATLSEVGRVAVTAPEELSEIVAEARMAQQTFAREPLATRRRLLERVAHALVDDADAIAETIVAESGKPPAEAYRAASVALGFALVRGFPAESWGRAACFSKVSFQT